MNLTKIQHGKALTKKNFPQFVETFNQMVDFIQNLRGDYDGNSASGHIKVDKSCITGPVISFEGDLTTDGSDDVHQQTLEVVTNVEWDSSTGQINITKREITFVGEIEELPTTTSIGTEPWTATSTPFPNVN